LQVINLSQEALFFSPMYRPKIKADKIEKKSRVRAPLYINFPYKKKNKRKTPSLKT